MTKLQKTAANRSIDRHLRIAVIAGATLVFGMGGWAATTELAGAVLANGVVVVDANVKKVQHSLGGIVAEIGVRNGQRVLEGAVLIRLDDTIARANLAVIEKTLKTLTIRRARLEAERDGAADLRLDGLVAGADHASLLKTEIGFFESRRHSRDGLRAQLHEQVAQNEEQIGGLTSQIAAYADSLSLVQQELAGLEALFAQKLVPVTRVMQLRRQEAEIRGTHAQTVAQIAQLKGKTSELRLRSSQIDEDLRTEVTGELSLLQEKEAELAERRIAALHQLSQVELRAPTDGVVHDLQVHTVGGVVEAGETLMLVVPDEGELSVEVRIDAQDRDQVHVGQAAILRMSAFNQRTTPELNGAIRVVAADLVEDERTGMRYYPVRITLAEGEEDRLGDKVLSPGMPVESFVQTGSRTVMSYLFKPLGDYALRAFRAD